MKMKILVACEESQAVTKELRKRGHIAYSCDLMPCSGGHPEWHIVGDCIPLLSGDVTFTTSDGALHAIEGKWDMILAFPPCTYLTRAGAANIPKDPSRIDLGHQATQFLKTILSADCPRIAIENPVPMKQFKLPRYDQIIHPYWFGDRVNKPTCLWLRGLPPLKPTNIVTYDTVIIKSSHGHKTLTEWFRRTNNVTKSKRSIIRSKTFAGVAAAMAEQWTLQDFGGVPVNQINWFELLALAI